MDVFPVLIVGGFLVVLTAVAAVAVAFGRNALSRIARLEEEVRALRTRPPSREPPQPVRAPEPVAVPSPAPPVPAAPATPAVPRVAAFPRTPTAPPPPLAPRPRATRIEWERWLGVRGAAVLGGVFLAVAGILFFQYSIERGLITKEMRIALGAFAGLACLAGGEAIRRRGYALTGNAITGAGAVILYAAFWSAFKLGIFAFGVSFAAMVLVTGLCAFLSWRNRSQVIAGLGLSGGFATPILLSTGRDEPIALFGYVLLLDVAFLFVANKRRWPLVGALGLVGTLLLQTLWILARMGPATFAIALIVLGVFALLFAFFAPRDERGSEGAASRLLTQTGAILLPFAFALYFAQRADVGYHLYPIALLCTLLAVAASWMARKQGATSGPLGAAVGGTAMALVWVLSNRLETGRAWELAVCAAVFVAAFLAFSEWRRADAGPARSGHDAALLLSACGMIAVLAAAAFRAPGVEVWPFLASLALLAIAILRLDALAPRVELLFLAMLPSAAALALWLGAHGGRAERPAGIALLLVALALPLLFLAAARSRREASGKRWGFAAAAIACLPFFPALAAGAVTPVDVRLGLVSPLLLGACMAAGASGARLAGLLGLAALSTAVAQGTSEALAVPLGPVELLGAFAIVAASSALFVAWPLFRRSAWTASRWIAWVAPLSACFGYFVAQGVWSRRGEGGSAGVPPAVYAALLLAAAAGALAGRRFELELVRARERTGTTAAGLVALVVAAFFLASALPAHLARPGFAFAAAGAALAAAFLWRRTDETALKYAAGLLTAAAGVRLLDLAFARSHVAEPLPVLNGHALDFLLPALAVLGATLWIRPAEVPRIREREAKLYGRRIPIVAGVAGLSGLFAVLLWITVEVENHFARSGRFRLDFGDDAARDLGLSIAWAIYALVLLFLGTASRSVLVRWVSLILLLATIGKLFLVDLEDLRGLYRVGSFLGLALSLLAVSWLYQRFVFRKVPDPVA